MKTNNKTRAAPLLLTKERGGLKMLRFLVKNKTGLLEFNWSSYPLSYPWQTQSSSWNYFS